MGVDLALWAKVVSQNPAKYKFKNLKGAYTDQVNAIVGDANNFERFIRHVCHNEEITFEDTDEEEWFFNDVRGGMEKIVMLVRDNPEVDMKTLDDGGFLVKYLEDWIEAHPITYILDLGGDCDVLIDDVFCLCQSCGRNPIWLEKYKEKFTMENFFNCSLCGSGFYPTNEYEITYRNLEVNLLPFAKTIREYIDVRLRLLDLQFENEKNSEIVRGLLLARPKQSSETYGIWRSVVGEQKLTTDSVTPVSDKYAVYFNDMSHYIAIRRPEIDNNYDQLFHLPKRFWPSIKLL